MQWYWWLLIGVGLVIFAYLKIKIGSAFLRRLQERQEAALRRLEEDK